MKELFVYDWPDTHARISNGAGVQYPASKPTQSIPCSPYEWPLTDSDAPRNGEAFSKARARIGQQMKRGKPGMVPRVPLAPNSFITCYLLFAAASSVGPGNASPEALVSTRRPDRAASARMGGCRQALSGLPFFPADIAGRH